MKRILGGTESIAIPTDNGEVIRMEMIVQIKEGPALGMGDVFEWSQSIESAEFGDDAAPCRTRYDGFKSNDMKGKTIGMCIDNALVAQTCKMQNVSAINNNYRGRKDTPARMRLDVRLSAANSARTS